MTDPVVPPLPNAPTEIVLRLYTAGNNSNSQQAIANLQKFCTDHVKTPYTLEVIDLCQNPEQAMHDQIVALPTLIRERPLPASRIIGDLSNRKRLAALLGVSLLPNANHEPL